MLDAHVFNAKFINDEAKLYWLPFVLGIVGLGYAKY